VVSNINSIMTYCNNCGHQSHCGTNFSVEDEDGFTGEAYKREICKHCRCEKCESNYEDEEKYNIES